jgi:hypothetical protein
MSPGQGPQFQYQSRGKGASSKLSEVEGEWVWSISSFLGPVEINLGSIRRCQHFVYSAYSPTSTFAVLSPFLAYQNTWIRQETTDEKTGIIDEKKLARLSPILYNYWSCSSCLSFWEAFHCHCASACRLLAPCPALRTVFCILDLAFWHYRPQVLPCNLLVFYCFMWAASCIWLNALNKYTESFRRHLGPLSIADLVRQEQHCKRRAYLAQAPSCVRYSRPRLVWMSSSIFHTASLKIVVW